MKVVSDCVTCSNRSICKFNIASKLETLRKIIEKNIGENEDSPLYVEFKCNRRKH